MSTWKKVLLSLAAVTIVGGVLIINQYVCVTALFEYGVALDQCPTGKVHPGLEASANAMRRGQYGTVRVSALAHYTTGPTDGTRTFYFSGVDPTLTLVNKGDEKRAITLKIHEDHRWKKSGKARTARVMLPPELGDGDYELRVDAKVNGADVRVKVPLAIYAPARVHVLTDRPLYEPGNTIQYRALVLRSRDLAPLDGRPGRWKVFDPSGELVLEEKAPAGDFGVATGELPLDASAPTGIWRIRWESAGTNAEARVTVEPFTLPRFTVEVSSVRPFYTVDQTPRVRVEARYSSGVPVRAARAELKWRFEGAWPPPPELLKALPSRAVTDKQGRVELELPEVPEDLRGQVQLVATVNVTDPAGDVAGGQGRVLFSEDKIQVSPVTELEGGLVEGFNNRLFLRAATASGAPLRDVKLRVSRAWDRADKGILVDTDADGVAVMQIDPGPAVNIVVPPMPVRPPPAPKPVERISARELIKEASPRLKDVVALDAWNVAIEPCIRFVDGAGRVELKVGVSASGKLGPVLAEGAAARCVAQAVRGRTLPAGPERIYRLGWTLRSDLASITADLDEDLKIPTAFAAGFSDALLDARKCIGRLSNHAEMPRVALWDFDGRALQLRFVDDPEATGPKLKATRARCIEDRVQQWARTVRVKDEGARQLGVLRFDVQPAASVRSIRPQARTVLGYELKIEALSEDEAIGETKLVLRPGSVPRLRLRTEPVVAKPGEAVKVSVLRGPDFDGELPEKVYLRHEKKTLEEKLDEKTREVTFKLPADLQGWWEINVQGAQARVYVLPKATLDVEVKPDKAAYRPGEIAKLSVKTTAAGAGTPASVSLVGVDETLGVLAPLPGPDALDGLRPTPAMSRPAFDGGLALEAAALVRGRIEGENARVATVLMVSRLPTLAELDVYVSGSQRTELDPLPVLVDNFYNILESLYVEVRAWEKSADKKEQMTPERMTKLWAAALTNTEKAGRPVTDIFDRNLELALLPEDLLLLVDPRVVVADGTRLPEDVENWVRWVGRNAS